jgi:hypothetical protein
LYESVPTSVGARTGLWLPDRDRLVVAAPATVSVPARLLILDAIGRLAEVPAAAPPCAAQGK